MRRKLGGDENPEVLYSLVDVGLARAFQGDTAAAERDIRSALQIRKHLLNASHPRIIASQVRLVEVLMSDRKLPEAEAILRDATQAAAQSSSPLLEWQLSEVHNALGACLVLEGKKTEGIPLLRGSLGMLQAYPQAALRRAALARSAHLLGL